MQPSDLEGVAYATADEVDGIRRTLDSFMKTQEQCNLSMETTLDKILGKLDKLSSREGTPIPEDKGSNMKSKPVVLTNKSVHFGPHQHTHPTYFYVPPNSTRAQFVHVTGTDGTITAHEMNTIDYELHDCPWTDLELEAFYELANKELDSLIDTSDQLPPKHTHQVMGHSAAHQNTQYQHNFNPVQQHFQSQMQH